LGDGSQLKAITFIILVDWFTAGIFETLRAAIQKASAFGWKRYARLGKYLVHMKPYRGHLSGASEAMSWAATTGDYTGDMVRDVML